jgi:uncharacterized damage-inducible protein DinB
MLSSVMSRVAGFQAEFLAEFEIATRQILALANAFPADAYDWYPDSRARTVSEVFVHIATGNYLLLDIAGVPVPADLYHHLPAADPLPNTQTATKPDPSTTSDRFSAFLRTNDDLVANIREKSEVIALLERSFEAVEEAFRQTSEPDLDRELHFGGQLSTVRRVYLRLLTHTHEHMGQMIAYLRCNNIAPPWPDWRPRDADQHGQH